MKNKKKSFYFDDYTESAFIEVSKPNIIKVSLNRVTFLSFIFFSLIIIFGIKIIYLSLSSEKNVFNNITKEEFLEKRRDIVDRNGSILATNVILYNVGVRPKLLKEKEKKNLLIKLSLLFPELDLDKIKNKLNKKDFFWIDKRLTPEEKDQFWLMGNKALVFDRKQSRIYPQQNLFSHILGQTDDMNSGISGVEKFFDENLEREDKINLPLKLTLDSNLQHLIRSELLKAEKDFHNIGSGAILMDVEEGKILSLVSLPDYDLNKRVSIDDSNFTNKITLDVYEFGSVFKTFTVAAGLEYKLIKSNTIFKNLKNTLTCDKYTISEHDKLPKNLSVEQILVRSSNIGAVRIAQKIGIEKYKSFLNKLGLFDTINFDLEEIGTPIPFNWGKCKLATSSYGHGITTTPLQLARAYAILGNGGYKIKPTILETNKNFLKEKEQIISNKTSSTINSMLRKVVSLDEGTAKFANIDGFDVGGKTGTAQKYNSNAKRNTFVSLFPASKPKYVLLVILDEPKPAPNFVYDMPPSQKFPNGYKHKGEMRNTSGWNTVVVAGKIIEKIGPILAINNLEASAKF
ncbi:MAG: penicillin-binding protein 2 [Candidatus Pelagibacterales bacterium]|nr:MAG: penicillin-binding protein 2 [Pelagibacterales bacterium]